MSAPLGCSPVRSLSIFIASIIKTKIILDSHLKFYKQNEWCYTLPYEKKEVPVTSERRGGRRRYETGTSNTVAAEKVIPVTDSTPKKGGRSRYSNKTYGNDSEKKKEEENQTGTFKPRRTRDNK